LVRIRCELACARCCAHWVHHAVHVAVSHPSSRNTRLEDLLKTAGWSRQETARRINEEARLRGSTGVAIDGSRVTRWIVNGEQPREAVGAVVAAVISDHLGAPVGASELGWARSNAAALPADHGLDVGWDSVGLRLVLKDWSYYMLSRRRFVLVTGAALTQPAWRAAAPAVAAPRPSHTEEVGLDSPLLLDTIDSIVARAQQLDERYGTAAEVFVHDQFHAVARLLRHGHYGQRAERRLALALAQLAQTAGFMAYDACRDADAQRWYLLGLRAAHQASDHALVASITALMSNHCIDLGRPLDALQLAAASHDAARREPPLVRALIAARGGLANAAMGDAVGYERAREATLTLLDRSHADPAAPPWAAYVTGTELDAIAGRGLVWLAGTAPTSRTALLARAEALLKSRAHSEATADSQRSALRHGLWLSVAHLRADDLELAVDEARTAAARLTAVTSARIRGQAGQLWREFLPHRVRSAVVTQLLDQLRT
jgi:hypothetical protein